MTQQQLTKYRKLGGWLKFFFIINVISILAGAASLLKTFLWPPVFYEYEPLLQWTYNYIELITTGVVKVAFSIAVIGMLFYRKRPCVWVFYAGQIVMCILVVVRLLTRNMGLSAFPLVFFLQAAQVAAWWEYFKRSERVRVYFMNDRVYGNEYWMSTE